jgi:hypothetical protein
MIETEWALELGATRVEPTNVACDRLVNLMGLYEDSYRATTEPAEIFVPPRPFALIEVTDRYREELAMLRATSRDLSTAPASGANSYAAMPIEGLWWSTDSRLADPSCGRGSWRWIAGVCLPPTLTDEAVARYLGATAEITSLDSRYPQAILDSDPAGATIAVAMYGDGHAVQAAHCGPPEDSRQTAQLVRSYIRDCGYEISGLYHEIYLTDRTTTASGEIETIVRQPFTRSGG